MSVTFKGSFNLILGCMFSSKTSELMKRYRRHVIGGKKCIAIKYKYDTRYDADMVINHDGIKIDAIACEHLIEVDDMVVGYDVVCVDEIQFYKDAHVFCEKWANEGKIVEACGLSGTFNRTPFPVISRLVPLAEDIVVLKAVYAGTGESASFTKLLVSKGVQNDIELIGGADKYRPVTRYEHYGGDRMKHDVMIVRELNEVFGSE